MTVLRSGSATDTGLVRTSNQDSLLVSASLFAVADGMGGHAGGEIAADIAVRALESAFMRHPSGMGLADAVNTANRAVWKASEERPELRGMGTTLTAVALVNEQGRDILALVNVGDSRTYRFHDGELVQITADHSVAEEMVRAGEITPAEAAVHPRRHILTRALGVADGVEVDLWRIHPSRGDRYLLCSDGLTNELGNGQIAEVLASVPDPQQAADLLVRAARTHGGADNITVVVVDVVLGDEERTAAEPAAGPIAEDFVISSRGASPARAVEPLAVPEARLPSRRERRRERRRTRSRRLVTVRTFVFTLLLCAVLAGAYQAVRWFDTSSFFVGLNGNELVIYEGRIGGFLWYQPAEAERTGVTTADVPAEFLPSLRSGVEESSIDAARTYVHNLEVEQALRTAPAAPPTGGLPPAPITTTTTKAGG